MNKDILEALEKKMGTLVNTIKKFPNNLKENWKKLALYFFLKSPTFLIFMSGY